MSAPAWELRAGARCRATRSNLFTTLIRAWAGRNRCTERRWLPRRQNDVCRRAVRLLLSRAPAGAGDRVAGRIPQSRRKRRGDDFHRSNLRPEGCRRGASGVGIAPNHRQHRFDPLKGKGGCPDGSPPFVHSDNRRSATALAGITAAGVDDPAAAGVDDGKTAAAIRHLRIATCFFRLPFARTC